MAHYYTYSRTIPLLKQSVKPYTLKQVLILPAIIYLGAGGVMFLGQSILWAMSLVSNVDWSHAKMIELEEIERSVSGLWGFRDLVYVPRPIFLMFFFHVPRAIHANPEKFALDHVHKTSLEAP